MVAPCSGPTIKKHILQVSTNQMAILMLFNKRAMLSFQVRSLHLAGTDVIARVCILQDLMQETQIGQKELMRAIQSLAMGKAQQRVLIWRNRRTDATSKDFSKC